MKDTAIKFWQLLRKECSRISKKGFKLSLNEDSYQSYLDNCNKSYKSYKNKYMKKDVINLDRHKVASILVIEGISLNIITPDEEIPGGKMFLGQEKILLSNALRFLVQQFNYQIERTDFNPMNRFDLPKAFSCDTKYDDIMARIQYFAKSEYCNSNIKLIAEMELADRFFLLEYISIHEFYGEKSGEIFRYLRDRAVSPS